MKRDLEPRLNEIFDWIDSQIDGRPYLLGETFSAADLYCFMLTRWGRNLPRKAWTLPSLGEHYRRLAERPSVAAMLAEAGHRSRPGVSSEEALARLRSICMAYPEAVEHEGGVGTPSFTVREKIFAMRHPHEGRSSMWCKAPPGIQGALVETSPERFFVPPYVGHRGWVGVWLDVELDWDEVEGLVDESYRMTAPKRLVAMLG